MTSDTSEDTTAQSRSVIAPNYWYLRVALLVLVAVLWRYSVAVDPAQCRPAIVSSYCTAPIPTLIVAGYALYKAISI